MIQSATGATFGGDDEAGGETFLRETAERFNITDMDRLRESATLAGGLVEMAALKMVMEIIERHRVVGLVSVHDVHQDLLAWADLVSQDITAATVQAAFGVWFSFSDASTPRESE